MNIEAYLQQSPLFEVSRLARRFESQLAQLFGRGQLGFLEGLVLVSLLFETAERQPIAPRGDFLNDPR